MSENIQRIAAFRFNYWKPVNLILYEHFQSIEKAAKHIFIDAL